MSNILKYLSKGSLYLVDMLEEAGYEAYFIGNVVRDALLNKHTNEVTICTNANVNDAYELFSNNNLDVQFSKYKDNILFIEKNGTIFEICSYLGDLEDYVKTRDFTVNALASDEHGTVIDYVSGLKDIRNKIIRSVDETYKDFESHPLRMLRAIKYSKILNFAISDDTINAITQYSNEISKSQIERINQEMKVILEYPFKDTYLAFPVLFSSAYFYKHKLNKKELSLIDNFPDHSMKIAYLCQIIKKDDNFNIDDLHLSNERKRVVKLFVDNYQQLKLKDFTIDYFKSLLNDYCIKDAYKIIQYNCYQNNIDILMIKNKINVFMDNLIDCFKVNITIDDIIDMGYDKKQSVLIYKDIIDNMFTGKIDDDRLSIIKYINKFY